MISDDTKSDGEISEDNEKPTTNHQQQQQQKQQQKQLYQQKQQYQQIKQPQHQQPQWPPSASAPAAAAVAQPRPQVCPAYTPALFPFKEIDPLYLPLPPTLAHPPPPPPSCIPPGATGETVVAVPGVPHQHLGPTLGSHLPTPHPNTNYSQRPPPGHPPPPFNLPPPPPPPPPPLHLPPGLGSVENTAPHTSSSSSNMMMMMMMMMNSVPSRGPGLGPGPRVQDQSAAEAVATTKKKKIKKKTTNHAKQGSLLGQQQSFVLSWPGLPKSTNHDAVHENQNLISVAFNNNNKGQSKNGDQKNQHHYNQSQAKEKTKSPLPPQTKNKNKNKQLQTLKTKLIASENQTTTAAVPLKPSVSATPQDKTIQNQGNPDQLSNSRGFGSTNIQIINHSDTPAFQQSDITSNLHETLSLSSPSSSPLRITFHHGQATNASNPLSTPDLPLTLTSSSSSSSVQTVLSPENQHSPSTVQDSPLVEPLLVTSDNHASVSPFEPLGKNNEKVKKNSKVNELRHEMLTKMWIKEILRYESLDYRRTELMKQLLDINSNNNTRGNPSSPDFSSLDSQTLRAHLINRLEMIERDQEKLAIDFKNKLSDKNHQRVFQELEPEFGDSSFYIAIRPQKDNQHSQPLAQVGDLLAITNTCPIHLGNGHSSQQQQETKNELIVPNHFDQTEDDVISDRPEDGVISDRPEDGVISDRPEDGEISEASNDVQQKHDQSNADDMDVDDEVELQKFSRPYCPRHQPLPFSPPIFPNMLVAGPHFSFPQVNLAPTDNSTMTPQLPMYVQAVPNAASSFQNQNRRNDNVKDNGVPHLTKHDKIPCKENLIGTGDLIDNATPQVRNVKGGEIVPNKKRSYKKITRKELEEMRLKLRSKIKPKDPVQERASGMLVQINQGNQDVSLSEPKPSVNHGETVQSLRREDLYMDYAHLSEQQRLRSAEDQSTNLNHANAVATLVNIERSKTHNNSLQVFPSTANAKPSEPPRGQRFMNDSPNSFIYFGEETRSSPPPSSQNQQSNPAFSRRPPMQPHSTTRVNSSLYPKAGMYQQNLRPRPSIHNPVVLHAGTFRKSQWRRKEHLMPEGSLDIIIGNESDTSEDSDSSDGGKKGNKPQTIADTPGRMPSAPTITPGKSNAKVDNNSSSTAPLLGKHMIDYMEHLKKTIALMEKKKKKDNNSKQENPTKERTEEQTAIEKDSVAESKVISNSVAVSKKDNASLSANKSNGAAVKMLDVGEYNVPNSVCSEQGSKLYPSKNSNQDNPKPSTRDVLQDNGVSKENKTLHGREASPSAEVAEKNPEEKAEDSQHKTIWESYLYCANKINQYEVELMKAKCQAMACMDHVDTLRKTQTSLDAIIRKKENAIKKLEELKKKRKLLLRGHMDYIRKLQKESEVKFERSCEQLLKQYDFDGRPKRHGLEKRSIVSTGQDKVNKKGATFFESLKVTPVTNTIPVTTDTPVTKDKSEENEGPPVNKTIWVFNPKTAPNKSSGKRKAEDMDSGEESLPAETKVAAVDPKRCHLSISPLTPSFGLDYYTSPGCYFRLHRLELVRRGWFGQLRSLTWSHQIKPNQHICRYDLQGSCTDGDCQYQHFRDMTLSGCQLIIEMYDIFTERYYNESQDEDEVGAVDGGCPLAVGSEDGDEGHDENEDAEEDEDENEKNEYQMMRRRAWGNKGGRALMKSVKGNDKSEKKKKQVNIDVEQAKAQALEKLKNNAHEGEVVDRFLNVLRGYMVEADAME